MSTNENQKASNVAIMEQVAKLQSEVAPTHTLRNLVTEINAWEELVNALALDGVARKDAERILKDICNTANTSSAVRAIKEVGDSANGEKYKLINKIHGDKINMLYNLCFGDSDTKEEGEVRRMRNARLPLVMQDGTEIHTLQDLRDNFSVERILDSWNTGELKTWLKDRYYGDIIDEITAVEGDADIHGKLYIIFGVRNPAIVQQEKDKERVRQERLEKLKAGVESDDDFEEFKNHINEMAFSQDELYDFLDEGITNIYLCGNKFEIPLEVRGISYYGVNKPLALIRVKEKIDLEAERGVRFSGVRFSENTLKNEVISFLISHKPGAIERLGNLFGSISVEEELQQILQTYSGYETQNAYQIFGALAFATANLDILAAIYEVVNNPNKEDYAEVLDEYGEAINILYRECFS